MIDSDRLARLEARFAINDLVTDLALAFDAGPSESLLLPLFTEDAVFVIDQFDTISGSKEIARGVSANSGRGFKWGIHYFLPPKTTLNEDSTSADATFYFWGITTSVRDRAYWIGARYTSRVLRDAENGRWQFKYLQLHAEVISHYAQGWTTKPASFDDV
jgi:hypothetical protein